MITPIRVLSYFHAGILFEIAKRAARISVKDPDCSIISIMFSVSALEAFINESVELARLVPTSDRQKVVDGYSAVMSELEERKEALLIKFHMGLLVFSGSTWDEGTQPFQDFKLLVTTRNNIVHMKADRWETRLTPRGPEPRCLDQYPKFIGALQQRKLVKLGDTPESESWLVLIRNKRVASWACETAAKITEKFVETVPDGYYKQSLKQHVFHGKRRR
ncbi:MAG: hypothetical protein HY735_03500 [Verrucomicrobia bacterium]|nr:hypothetical protein [Verrucomicrobiota bacterium]